MRWLFWRCKKMYRKFFSVFFAAVLVLCALSFHGCAREKAEGGEEMPEETGHESGAADEDFKIGVILLGDESEGYTAAHIDGVRAAASELQLEEDQILWRYDVPEDGGCYDTAMELAAAGCEVIFSNSYNHQSSMEQAAREKPDVTFVAITGDTAAVSGLDNFCNAFTKIYEARYVSGVVAGMKLAELAAAGSLIENNYDADGNILVGYVGAYPYAEETSAYTAFFLGIRSVVENVEMQVQYANAWFDVEKERAAANLLMENGCVIIGQGSDSTGVPAAVQDAYDSGKQVYLAGYNVDLLHVAPDVALTSAASNWAVYYKLAISAAQRGEKLPKDWAEGYAQDAVGITVLGSACAAGTAERVEEVERAIRDGDLQVFDISKFTVDGKQVESCIVDLNNNFDTSDAEDMEAIWDGCFHESELRSAPSFSLHVDGIVQLNAD